MVKNDKDGLNTDGDMAYSSKCETTMKFRPGTYPPPPYSMCWGLNNRHIQSLPIAQDTPNGKPLTLKEVLWIRPKFFMAGVRWELKLGIEQFVVVRIEEKIMFQLLSFHYIYRRMYPSKQWQ